MGLVVLCAAVVRADEIDDTVAAQMSRQHIPGLALAVLQDGKPLKVQGYGFENLETATRAVPETVFQIGSVSKQFIAAGILRLSDEGKVGLDDSIRKYLGDAPDAWQPVTLRHLLSHTSGLVRETPDLQLKVQSVSDAVRAAYPTPLAFAPGEKWQYSNLGYFALAEVITQASGVPWPRYLQERIFGPLGMTATRTTSVEELVLHRAAGYQWMDRNQYQNAPVIPGVRPSGAFLSSVIDLARWDAALQSDEQVSPAHRQLMWAATKLNDGSEKPYGFGWELGKLGRHAVVKHSGTMLGFRSHILRFVDERLTIVVLTNATQAVPEKISLGIAAHYLPDLKAQQTRRVAANFAPETAAAYAGRYQFAGGRVLSVTAQDGRLAVAMSLALPGMSKELSVLVHGVSMNLALLAPETESRFFDEEDPRSTYVFSKDAEGRVQLAIEDPSGKTGASAWRVDAATGAVTP